MSADDDLRAELRGALRESMLIGPGMRMRTGDEVADALLPAIRTHLAQAYAHGWRANAPHTPDAQIATRNPYEPANTRP